jgi:formylglycine-generating enzyme required for sulfatase activity
MEIKYRVIRGGSWVSDARVLYSACRFGGSPGSRGSYVGFRLVRMSMPKALDKIKKDKK